VEVEKIAETIWARFYRGLFSGGGPGGCSGLSVVFIACLFLRKQSPKVSRARFRSR
jgi:hypothetical protein